MTKIIAVLSGNYSQVIESRQIALMKGSKIATANTSGSVKDATRRDIRRAGYKNPVPNLIQDEVYPSGDQLSYSPSAQIFSTAPHIIAPAAIGLRVAPQSADSLVIPLSDSPAKALRRRRGQSLVDAAKEKWGNLQVIKRPGKTNLLAAKIRNSKGDKELTPLFSLPKSAVHQKTLRTLQIFDQAKRDHPRAVLNHLGLELEKSVSETAIR